MFILLGRMLEALAKGRTSESIRKLLELQPKTALVVRDNKEQEIPVEEVIVGDTVIVKPGGNVPVDGVVLEGSSSVDQSLLTGESIPVEKNIGDEVIGGTMNKSGWLKFKATKVGKDTALAQIVRLVEEAQGSKAPVQRLADTVSAYFVPTVLSYRRDHFPRLVSLRVRSCPSASPHLSPSSSLPAPAPWAWLRPRR